MSEPKDKVETEENSLQIAVGAHTWRHLLPLVWIGRLQFHGNTAAKKSKRSKTIIRKIQNELQEFFSKNSYFSIELK